MAETTLKLKPISSDEDYKNELKQELQSLEKKFLTDLEKEFNAFVSALHNIEIPATGAPEPAPVASKPAPVASKPPAPTPEPSPASPTNPYTNWKFPGWKDTFKYHGLLGLGRRLFKGTDPERDSVWRYVNAEGTKYPSLQEYLEIERRSKSLVQEMFIAPMMRSLMLRETTDSPHEQVLAYTKQFQNRVSKLLQKAMFDLYQLGRKHGVRVENLPDPRKVEPSKEEPEKGLTDEEVLQIAQDILQGKIHSDKLSLSPKDLERVEKAVYQLTTKDEKVKKLIEPEEGEGESKMPLFANPSDSKKKSESPEVTEDNGPFFDRQTLEMFPLPENVAKDVLRHRGGYTKSELKNKDRVEAIGEAMFLLSHKAIEIAKQSPEKYIDDQTVDTLSKSLKISPEELGRKSPIELAALAILNELANRAARGEKIPDMFYPEKLDTDLEDEPEEIESQDTGANVTNIEQARQTLINLGYELKDFQNMPDSEVIKLANLANSAGDVSEIQSKGKGKQKEDPLVKRLRQREETLQPIWSQLFGERVYQDLVNKGYKPYLWFRVPRRKSKQPFQPDLIDVNDPHAVEGLMDLYIALKSGDLFGGSIDPSNVQEVKNLLDSQLEGGYQGKGNVFPRLREAIKKQEGDIEPAEIIERLQKEAENRGTTLSPAKHKSVVDLASGQKPEDADDDYFDQMLGMI